MSNKPPSAPQQPAANVNNVFVDYVDDHEIVVYRLNAINRSILDQWASIILSTLQAWPADKPYMAIHDLSARQVALSFSNFVRQNSSLITPKLDDQAAVQEIINSRPNFRARVATVFNDEFSGHLGHLLISRKLPNTSMIMGETFVSVADALAWLRPQLVTTKPTAKPSRELPEVVEGPQ